MDGNLAFSPSLIRSQQGSYSSAFAPAPVRGMNAMGSVAAMSPLECIYTYNLMPNEYGMTSRLGSREWARDVPGTGIRTVLPYGGLAESNTDDRLFAVSNDGIFDVTTDGELLPSIGILFSDKTEEAGYGHFINHVNDAADRTLLLADSRNGMFTYDAATDTWAQTAGITGPDVTKIAFIMIHKQRLWMIERDSADAWYLDPGAKTGAATKFSFGNKFKHGGILVGLYNWTLDGGDGVDDYLVAISRLGDIAMYRGTDPATAATWETTGTWFIGEVPTGRRIATEVGGTLHVLSSMGVISMRDLVSGVDVSVAADTIGIAAKISRIIRDRMKTELRIRGWELRTSPEEGELVVNSPARFGLLGEQYVLNFETNGWGIWRGLDMMCCDNWNGKLYFGKTTGQLFVLEGEQDNVTILDSEPISIEFSILHSYNNFESPGEYKRPGFVRPSWISKIEPRYNIQILFDYDLSELVSPGDSAAQAIGVWDVGVWDSSVWGGEVTSHSSLSGSGGFGRSLAVAIRGTAAERVTLVATELTFEKGWFL